MPYVSQLGRHNNHESINYVTKILIYEKTRNEIKCPSIGPNLIDPQETKRETEGGRFQKAPHFI